MIENSTASSTLEEAKDTGTAGSDVTTFPSPSETRTGMAILTDYIGFNRSKVGIIGEDVTALHHKSRLGEWLFATTDVAKSDPLEILNALADLGFAWRDIAKMIGVSVPALQKWRRGEKCTGNNRRNLAQLLAACQMVQEHYEVDEISSWFEMPIYPGIPITPIDLYQQNEQVLLFEYAGNSTSLEEILNQFEPNWREKFQSDYEVFENSDGDYSIRSAVK